MSRGDLLSRSRSDTGIPAAAALLITIIICSSVKRFVIVDFFIIDLPQKTLIENCSVLGRLAGAQVSQVSQVSQVTGKLWPFMPVQNFVHISAANKYLLIQIFRTSFINIERKPFRITN